MAQLPLQNFNKAVVISKENRNVFVNNKRTDKIEGVNLVVLPLGKFADVMKLKGTIKIKLPNEEFDVQELQKIELINLTVSPYVSSRSRYVQYSFSADGFRPIDNDAMSSEKDVE